MIKRRAIAPAAIAVVAVVIVVIAGVGAYVLLTPGSTHSTSSSSSTSTSTSTAPSSTVALTGCVFSPPPDLQAPSTTNLNFSGCLTAGSTGTYLVAATDPDGLNMTGTITATYPIQVTIQSAKVGNLLEGAGLVYTANDTKSANVFSVTLLPSNGYGIIVRNEGGQNNTVTMTLQLADISQAGG